MVAMFRSSGLKSALLIPFSVFVVVLVFMVLMWTYFNERTYRAGRLELKIDQIEGTLRRSMDKDIAKMRAVLTSLTQMERLKALFLKRDREGLYALSRGMFEEFRTHNLITHFYFTKPDRVCFLRAHQLNRHGDRIDRHTTLMAESGGQIGAGLELGPMGTFTLRAVMPWQDQGGLIGYIELGKEIDNVLAEIRDVFDVNLLVFVPKKKLNREGWEQGMRMLGRQPEWDRFQDVVLVNSEEGLPTEELHRLLLSKSGQRPVYGEEKIGESWYDVVQIQLRNVAGENAAYIFVVEDVTAQVLSLRKFMITVFLLSLAGGAGLILLFRGILDRAEKNLARAEDREKQLGRIMNSLKEAVFIFDGESLAALEINNGASEKLGYNLAEMQALPLERIWPEHDPETIHALLGPLRRGERDSLTLESLLCGVDGSTYPVEIYLEYFDFHTPPLFVAIAQDISERKQAEKELHDAHAELRAIIDNSMVGVLFFSEANATIRVNQRLVDMFGYEIFELLGGGPDFDHLLLEAGLVEDDVCLSSVCAGEVVEVERLMHRKDGSPIWCVVSSRALTSSNCLDGVVSVFMDTTGRKDLEKLREDVDRIMHHDLKTPLNGITSLTRVLLEDNNFTGEQTEILRLIQEQGQRMLSMVNRSLDLFKMETGTYQYRPEPVDMLELIRRLLRDQSEAVAHKGGKLEGEIRGVPLAKAASLQVQIEEPLAYSMLANLLVNAAEGSPRGKSIFVRVEEEEEWIVLAVRNMGVVPPAIRDTFFDKYATHGKSGGTGLGTYSAKLMAETMGGTIGFTSSEEEGTIVTVRLPKG